MNLPVDKLEGQSPYVVTEGVNGYWSYHLSIRGREHFGLCGRQTMRTSIPFSQWGVGRAAPEGSGLNGSWCHECERAKG